MDISKELAKNKLVLAVIPSTKYNQVSLKIVKDLSKKRVCYVTTNKTYGALSETFKKKRVNLKNIIFIDAISKSLGAGEESDQSLHVSSPGALTELSLVIGKVLKHEFDYLIFDSLTNLMTYNPPEVVSKFISSMGSKIKKSGTKAVFYALDVKEHEGMIQKCGMYVDKVIPTK